MKAYSWMNCVLGIWLMVAAFVFTYSTGMRPATTEEVAMGFIIFFLGGWDGLARPNQILSWLTALAGLVTIAAPWWVSYSGVRTFAHANDIVVGVIVLILGCAGAMSQHRAARVHA